MYTHMRYKVQSTKVGYMVCVLLWCLLASGKSGLAPLQFGAESDRYRVFCAGEPKIQGGRRGSVGSCGEARRVEQVEPVAAGGVRGETWGWLGCSRDDQKSSKCRKMRVALLPQ